MRLYDFFTLNTKNSIIKNIHYFPIYERYFAQFVGQPVTMLEIGTGEGGSAVMWKQYFGPRARIVTIDVEDKAYVAEPQIYPRRGSQSDPAFLSGLINEFGPFDIVLDDGSHMMQDIATSFEALFRSTRSVYLVEDLDGAYWPDRGGGLRAPLSFIERAKTLVDEMNAKYTEGALDLELGKHICSVAFYHMIVVIEKTPFLNDSLVRNPPLTPRP